MSILLAVIILYFALVVAAIRNDWHEETDGLSSVMLFIVAVILGIVSLTVPVRDVGTVQLDNKTRQYLKSVDTNTTFLVISANSDKTPYDLLKVKSETSPIYKTTVKSLFGIEASTIHE